MPAAEDSDFVVYFSFDETGYVKDAEKDLDADKILASIREGNEHANEYRRKKGWAAMEVVGWDQAPFYDAETKRLTWAIRGRSEGHDVVNYNSRILGRKGVISANLACSPEALAATVPVYKGLLEGFDFTSGNRYAEFRKGDKVAAYGLAALVTGGAAVGAAKLGLFGKLGAFLVKSIKLVALAVLGVFMLVGRFVKGLFSKKDRASP